MIARKQELEKEIEYEKSHPCIVQATSYQMAQKNKIKLLEAELKGIVDTEKHYKEKIGNVILVYEVCLRNIKGLLRKDKLYTQIQLLELNTAHNDAISKIEILEDLKKRLFGDG